MKTGSARRKARRSARRSALLSSCGSGLDQHMCRAMKAQRRDSRCTTARLDRKGEHRQTSDDENRGGGVHGAVRTVCCGTVRRDEWSRSSTQALEATCECIAGSAVRSRELWDFRGGSGLVLTARTIKWTSSFRSYGIYHAIAVTGESAGCPGVHRSSRANSQSVFEERRHASQSVDRSGRTDGSETEEEGL